MIYLLEVVDRSIVFCAFTRGYHLNIATWKAYKIILSSQILTISRSQYHYQIFLTVLMIIAIITDYLGEMIPMIMIMIIAMFTRNAYDHPNNPGI